MGQLLKDKKYEPLKGSRRFKNLVGDKFGKLLAAECLGTFNNKIFYLCECDCGNTKEVSANHLRSGATTSCGCHHKSIVTKHGKYRTAEYNAWAAMKRRCSNVKDKNYHLYGGRGILVCDRWRKSFAAFFLDMGPRPSSKHSIDRKNNNEGYSPENCRWAIQKVQRNNTSTNRYMTLDGRTTTLAIWAEELGIPHSVIRGRLKLGWSENAALTTPYVKRVLRRA